MAFDNGFLGIGGKANFHVEPYNLRLAGVVTGKFRTAQPHFNC